VNSFGYRVEQHKVVTEDKYILTLFRIPGLSRGYKKHNTASTRPPVLLQHGILDSSDAWVVRGGESAAITLAYEGYDVWLGNSRGTKFSKEHISMDIENEDYWQFSFEECGDYDLPATIDYVLKETKYEKVAFVAHSMGNTLLYYAMSKNLKYYQERISVVVALAPAITLSYSASPLFQIVINKFKLISTLFKKQGMEELFSADSPMSMQAAVICPFVP
jgi:lysosomal acid lipase/cholesteryl ester hydrolase